MKSVIILLIIVSVAFAEPLSILVPAYFPPWSQEGINDFNSLKTAATQLGPRLTVILNMNSGPESPSWGYFNYFVQLATDLRNSGARVVGYVYTEYGNRDQAAILADIDSWFDGGCPVDGIFFDQVSTDVQKIPFYATLYSHVQSKAAAHSLPHGWVVLNQGTCIDGLEGFLAVGDIIVVLENQGSALKKWSAPNWVKAEQSSKFNILIWNQALWRKTIKAARSNNVGHVYSTDLSASYWNSLPSYWEAFLACVVTECD